MYKGGAKKKLKDYLAEAGLKPGQNIIVHASFRMIREAFPGISPEDVISALKELIGSNGSVIFPAFTYSFKKSVGDFEFFDKIHSPSKTGIISEIFRKSEGVRRTSSPTHSFSLWGKAADSISCLNSPSSPLGYGSVMDWLAGADDGYVLMLGTDFTSLTLAHYIECVSGALYLKISPWSYMHVLPCGISVKGEQALTEIPGCSRSFTRLESFLIEKKLLRKFCSEGLNSCFMRISHLIQNGISYLKEFPTGLLCPEGTCRSCDERYVFLKTEDSGV